MSNIAGRILTQQALFRPSVVENQSKAHHGVHANLCAVPYASKSENGVSRSLLSTGFLGKTLIPRQGNLHKQSSRKTNMIPHAAFAADHSSGQERKFKFDMNSELEVKVFEPTSGSLVEIDLKATNYNSSLVLHWGAIHHKRKEWELPSRQPDRTKVYNNEALRTPFTKSGSTSSLKIEIDDPEIQAVEFLLVNEAENKWFKNDDQNFQIQLLQRNRSALGSAVPEELVQIQARRRWERNGRPTYTPDQEKREHEAARTELLEELRRGTSVEQLRSRLTKRPDETLKDGVPDDLVGIVALIRWHKAGKPKHSPDEKHREFEAASKELQREFDKGTSLDDIKTMILEKYKEVTDSKQAETKNSSIGDRIKLGKKDIVQHLSKNISKNVEQKFSQSAKDQAVLELWSKAITEQEDESMAKEKKFKLGDKNLQVVVSKPSGRTKVYLATDQAGPLILHWGLSKKSGEWMVPPSSVVPSGSIMVEGSCQTPFTNASIGDKHYQTTVIEIDGGDYTGLPFVLLSDGKWIKNNGMDFNVALEIGSANKKAGDGRGTAKSLLDQIADLEVEAQKSFMHRFRIAADLTEQAKDEGQQGLVGILVWMRFMAMRQLIWNKNYNVKPREISQAQDRLTSILQNIYKDSPEYREFLRMIMASVGRGGEGDVGQRIRDEILVIQRNNRCEGGMMEEWHQKLHNNTSPDDVIICQALIDYIKSDFNISVYWDTLNKNGITKERLLSYDRAIHSEPSFGGHQKDGLLRDLGHYMRTLKAVHSGADLESAISTCMGYKSEGKGFMVGVQINPIGGLPSGFPDLMRFILEHVEDKIVEPLIKALLEARRQLKPLLCSSHDRLKDLIFLDISLDNTVRTAIERGYENLNNAEPGKIMYLITLVLENLALSTDENEDLMFCIKGWNHAMEISNQGADQWALIAKSCLDRTRIALSSKAEHYHQIVQPSAEYLGALLGVEQWAISVFTEEIIRAGSAASLSTLLNRLDPVLRRVANLGSWQIISPVEVAGYVEVVDGLLAVQDKSYKQPTILIAKSVKGEEEIPDGIVAVLTPDMPDVLSHVSVRARNSKVCFATCFDANILAEFQKNIGKLFRLKPTSADILYSEIQKSELPSTNASKDEDEQSPPSMTLVKKQFSGRYAISAEEFTNEMVGAKSLNISFLKGKVPSWVGIPTSVALPFGVFEEVLSDAINKEIAGNLQTLKQKLSAGESDALVKIRNTVLKLSAPPKLVQELKQKMQESGMPWPGDEGQHRWELAWMAIKRVWASKWNERAYFSTRKVKLDHDCLCMAVLVQEIISADYAFVIHTTNPSSGDSSEIYAEVVKGLGETLVGAYPGRALSFVCKKNSLDSPKVLGYPSKPIGLFIERSIIFRSDSNGEDLEGYAGAGLYDSVPMDEEEEVVLDYVSDPLMMDKKFQSSILSRIARAGHAIEELYGSPQDIEGVVKDDKIFVVQTRPQM